MFAVELSQEEGRFVVGALLHVARNVNLTEETFLMAYEIVDRLREELI